MARRYSASAGASALAFVLFAIACAPGAAQTVGAGKPTGAVKPATPAAPPKPPAATPKPDAIPEAARAAWDLLPLADRKAMQDALVWTAGYNSILDGNFGRNTFDALKVFEAKNGLNVDGQVDKTERSRLLAAGEAARKFAQFTVTSDTVTGASIGVPLAWVNLPTKTDRGSQWVAKSKVFTLSTEAYKAGEKDLNAFYEQLKADTKNGRKVDYAVLKPDWFVVSGEAGGRKFYTRYATNETKALRGYTFSYDKSEEQQGSVLVIAIANSFEPFAAKSVSTITFDPNGNQKSPPQPQQPTTPASPPQPTAKTNPLQPTAPTTPPVSPAAGPQIANGLALAPGKVLTVANAVDGCRTITVGKAPATVLKRDAALGLALLDASPAEARPSALTFRPASPGIADLLIVLGYSEAAGKLGPLVMTSGETLTAPAKPGRETFRVLAPLQRGGTGAVVTDRSGALVAMITRMPREPRQIAGIVPQMPHEVVTGSDIAGFLGTTGLKLPAATSDDEKTAGEIATLSKPAVVPVLCTR